MGNMGLYIGPTYEVRGDCLRTLTRMEMKGICLCKQAMNVEDSPRTIVKPGAGGLECPAILIKTLTGLMVLNPKENPLTQAIVFYNNPMRHLRIAYSLLAPTLCRVLCHGKR